MTADQVNEIIELMKSREQAAEGMAKDNALQALTGSQANRAGHEKNAHESLREARTWGQAWVLLRHKANEFFEAHKRNTPSG